MTAREFLGKIYGTEGVDGSEFTIPLDSAAHYMEVYNGMLGRYTKEEILKAAEIGEVSMIDAKHIVSLLDEARQLI